MSKHTDCSAPGGHWNTLGSKHERARRYKYTPIVGSGSVGVWVRASVETKLRGTFDIRSDWVTELRDAKDAQVDYIHTSNNYADLLTKSHTPVRFDQLVGMFGTHVQACFTLDHAPRGFVFA